MKIYYNIKKKAEMRVPFEVSVEPFYNPANQKVLEASIQQLDSGKGTQHDLIEVADE